MNQFKKGDKVYIKKVGKWAKILSLAGISMGVQKYNIEDETGGGGWIFENDLEKFIEPKFKVGDKIYCYPSSHKDKGMGDTCEIVKFALNKKKGAYSYMAFNKNGFVYSFQEHEVILKEKPKVCCGKVCQTIEMTIEEVEEKFNKNAKKIGSGLTLKIIK